MPRHRTDAAVLGKSGVYQSTGHSALKTARKKIAPLTNAARLRFALSQLLTNPHARMVVAARGDALFGLADLGLGKCEACQRLAMHLSMLS